MIRNALSLIGVLALLCGSSSSLNAAEVRPKYGPTASRIIEDHLFIKTSNAPDYWALSPYYTAQRDHSACILATFTMALNAFKIGEKATSEDALVNQDDLFNKIKEEPAAKRFYVNKGKSISLVEMGELFKKAVEAYKIPIVKLEAVNVDKIDAATKEKVKNLLRENEKSARTLILANFLQSEFTGDPDGGGHAAPVGAYDPKTDRVLIMDPDREYYEPYWVSFETFMKGLATLDKDAGRNRGILFVEIKK